MQSGGGRDHAWLQIPDPLSADKSHDFDRIAPGIEAEYLYKIVHGSYRLWGRVYPICRVEVTVYPRDRRNNSGDRDRSEVKIS